MTLTRAHFNRQCIQFVDLSNLYSDGWYVSDKNGRPCGSNSIVLDHDTNVELMLMKNSARKRPDCLQLCNYEHSVVYSESYEVPVMYFSASNQNGSHLPLDDLITSHAEDIAKMVNQVEHPLLFRPFYMIHPCRTRDFMEPHRKLEQNNYLICWLSTIGTLIDLRLNPKFGLSITQTGEKQSTARDR